MYPPQPPNEPHQGGQDPYQQGQSANPYQQDSSGYPGQPADPYQQNQPAHPYHQGASGYPGQPGPHAYPGVPPQSDKMPGTAITVRVLMFIGGVVGLLFGGLVLLLAAAAGGEGEFAEGFAEGVGEAGVYVDPSEVVILMLIVGGIMFVYGLVSTILASVMGKRSGAVLWGIVVFQSLAALSLLINMLTGAFGAVVPLFFAIGMIVLMLVPASRAYYTPKPANPYTGY